MNKKVSVNLFQFCRALMSWRSIIKNNLYLSCPAALSLVFLFLVSYDAIAGTFENPCPAHEMKVVWAADQGQGEQIYFSSFEKNIWSAPVQLSHEKEMAFQPAVSSGCDGKNWAVWSHQNKAGSFLQFAVYNSTQWSTPLQIDTEMNTNTASAIIVGSDNIPVIAWTGIDNLYPDIFWSRWNGKSWDLPQKVHVDNEVPDLQPALYLDTSGNIALSWQTFLNGKYVEVVKMFQDGQWQSISNQLMNETAGRTKVQPIPEFIQDMRKATFFIRNSDGAHSVLPSRR